MDVRSLAIGLLMLASGTEPTTAQTVRQPTVVELFQSQGCSSCPPALANVNALGDRPDVLALSFAVTYWDQLGWKDSFAKPEFTARQWEYARAAGRHQVATPQTIINGRVVINGGDRRELEHAIASHPSIGPVISTDHGRIVVGAGRSVVPATVWLVVYDRRTIDVAIRAGENGGRTLPHRNIVRGIDRLGEWSGAAARFRRRQYRCNDPNRRFAVLVQQGRGGPIVAAKRL